MSGLGCIPLIEAASINQRLEKVDEWLSKYEDQFGEGSDSSETRAESEEESDHPGVAPATPANIAVRKHTPSKRKRTSKNMMKNTSCRARLVVE